MTFAKRVEQVLAITDLVEYTPRKPSSKEKQLREVHRYTLAQALGLDEDSLDNVETSPVTTSKLDELMQMPPRNAPESSESSSEVENVQ